MTTESKDHSHPIDGEQKQNLIDLFKHQTTLCTATIVLTMAVVGSFIPQPMTVPIKTSIGLSLIFLLGSLFLSFIALVNLITGIENHTEWKRQMYLSFSAFILGLLVLMFIILLA